MTITQRDVATTDAIVDAAFTYAALAVAKFSLVNEDRSAELKDAARRFAISFMFPDLDDLERSVLVALWMSQTAIRRGTVTKPKDEVASKMLKHTWGVIWLLNFFNESTTLRCKETSMS